MYTEKELQAVSQMKKKRWWIALIPMVAALAAAIVIFVYGQVNRSDTLWGWTAALTVLGGVYFLFYYGLCVRPVSLYERHVRNMIHGRKHENTGLLKELGEQVCEKNGIECRPVMINIGEKDDGKDDRLYYFDLKKEWSPAGSCLRCRPNPFLPAWSRIPGVFGTTRSTHVPSVWPRFCESSPLTPMNCIITFTPWITNRFVCGHSSH